MPRFPVNRLTAILVAGMLLPCVASFFAGRYVGVNASPDRHGRLPDGAIPCKPGPWGDLSYTPFTIAAPDDVLPIRGFEAAGTHWFLKGYSADRLVALLQSTGLSSAQQRAFLDPAVLHVQKDGIDLTPSPDLVFSLPDDARGQIYRILALNPDTQINFIPADSLDERFSASGVSPDTVALFKRLCWQRNNSLIFSSYAALFSRLPSYEEKVRVTKAVTRQRTMLLHLHVSQQSDVDSLAAYWGKGCWDTDVRTILQSLTVIPGGTWINILIVLPPLPSSELYYFPTVVDNPANGPPLVRDCNWTSLNFFRDVPDPEFANPDGAVHELKDNYYPVPGDPMYGDVAAFTAPNGALIHTAVYIADDIYFTKNGASVIQPWMLARLSDLLATYSILVDPNEKISVSYYREKRF